MCACALWLKQVLVSSPILSLHSLDCGIAQLAAMAAEQAEQQPLLCAICQQDLNDGTPVQALSCTHTMHDYCIGEWANAKQVPIASVPCPVCRRTAESVAAADAWNSQEDPSDESVEPEAEIVPESPEPEPEELVAEPAEPEAAVALGMLTGSRKGKGKAGKTRAQGGSRKGNGKAGKTKAQAKPKAEPKAKQNVRPKAKGKGKKGQNQQVAPEAPAEPETTNPEPEATNPEPEASNPQTEAAADVVAFTQCFYCGDECEKKHWNCISKVRDEWKCSACGVSRTIMFRGGCFRAPDLSFQSQQERNEFWKQAQGLDSQGKLALARHTVQSKISSESTQSTEDGSFYPLSYWEKQGLDTERIARMSPPENVREDAVLGVCYKVVIHSDTKKRKIEHVLQDNTEASSGSSSSSGLSGLSIAQLIQKERDDKQQEKKEMRNRLAATSKALAPGHAMLKVLTGIKNNLKVEKLPGALAVANPLADSIEFVQKAMTAVQESYCDENVQQLVAELAKAKHVAKSMRAFT